MEINTEVIQWPDDMRYPYGKKCGGGDHNVKIVDNVCLVCGYSYRQVHCQRCRQWYGESYDQGDDPTGCPSCAGIINYPSEFYLTDTYKEEQVQKRREKEIGALKNILSWRFDGVRRATISDLVTIAMDLHLSNWLDGMAHGWVEMLLTTILAYSPTIYDEFYDAIEEALSGTTE